MTGEDARSSSQLIPPRPVAGREYLELWINLARREWGSLVVIPADRDGSTSEIASALADIGQRLSYGPVTAITVSSLEYGSALALADLQQHLERERNRRTQATTVVDIPQASAPADPRGADSPPAGPATPQSGQPSWKAQGEEAGTRGEAAPPAGAQTEALAVIPQARLIISVPSILAEPLGLAAAEEADAVVLAVRMQRSCISEVKRTIELIGRERITGCFLVR